MILLCEPQCFSFEHAAFNAALLATVRVVYPDDEILFFAEPGHVREVEGILTASQAAIRVTWQPIEIPAREPGGLRRWPAERKLLKAIMARAQSTPVRSILFCSATETTILALKRTLRSTPAPCNVRIVLHGVLRSLIEARWRKPWRWGFSLRQALRTPHPPALKYIALSESIRAHAVRAEPKLGTQLRAMDMPRLWSSHVPLAKREGRNTRFGFFGSTAKGFQHFYELARNIKAQEIIAGFSLVGFLNGRDLQRGYQESIVDGLARAPLSQAEYSHRAGQVDYAVWPANPTHYSLTASASFLDALDYLKPVIYLANPYIDSYLEQMGDIGYRCETLADMQTIVQEIARGFPEDRYQKQREAILCGRELFEPSVVASKLKQIMEEAG